MPENIPHGGLDDRAWMADVETRLSALELRPQVIAPIGLAPAPIGGGTITVNWEVEITNAAFGTVWEAQVSRWSRQALWAVVPWRTEAGTTGELRVEASFSTTSGTVTLAAASSGTATFRWLHSQDVWSPAASLAAWVTARRTGGANKVVIGYPYLALVDPAGATLNGF